MDTAIAYYGLYMTHSAYMHISGKELQMTVLVSLIVMLRELLVPSYSASLHHYNIHSAKLFYRLRIEQEYWRQ